MARPHTPRYKAFYLLTIALALLSSCDSNKTSGPSTKRVTYYLNVNGNDSDAGTLGNPWKTIDKLNTAKLHAGDSVIFLNGTFEGSLIIDSADAGTSDSPVVLTSPKGSASTINSGNARALSIHNTSNVRVVNLKFAGNGRKDGNKESGVVIMGSDHISVDSLEIQGFQKSGLLIYNSSDIDVNRIYAHDNGAAGISASGTTAKTDCQNISIRHSFAENNPGDPTNLTNHSGNGIIVGLCRKVLIEYCAATNNGWDMPRVGNGPVGIWAYEADSVTIQHCIAYRNKTSHGGEDGGGFDFDGGMTNSVIQYCLSYENEGSGFGIFQYSGASPWKNNTVRFNISENDGLVSTAHSGIYIWNGANDESQFTDCFIYNNVIYNSPGAAIRYNSDSKRKRFLYYNNIFVAKDQLTAGQSLNDTFLGNDWWSLNGGFNMNGILNLNTWAGQTGQETMDGQLVGVNMDPGFETTIPATITDPAELPSFTKYRLPANSVLRAAGMNLEARDIDNGGKDFNQNSLSSKGIGASF